MLCRSQLAEVNTKRANSKLETQCNALPKEVPRDLHLSVKKTQSISQEFVASLRFLECFGNMRPVQKAFKTFNLGNFSNFSRQIFGEFSVKFPNKGWKFPHDDFWRVLGRIISLKNWCQHKISPVAKPTSSENVLKGQCTKIGTEATIKHSIWDRPCKDFRI